MFIPILYVVFEHFLSKLIILHDQSMYDVHKLMTIICMIFFNFTKKNEPWKHQMLKTGPVNRKNGRFTNSIQNFHQFKFCIDFQSILMKPIKPIRFNF
jgi:hypothetical protein